MLGAGRCLQEFVVVRLGLCDRCLPRGKKLLPVPVCRHDVGERARSAGRLAGRCRVNRKRPGGPGVVHDKRWGEIDWDHPPGRTLSTTRETRSTSHCRGLDTHGPFKCGCGMAIPKRGPLHRHHLGHCKSIAGKNLNGWRLDEPLNGAWATMITTSRPRNHGA